MKSITVGIIQDKNESPSPWPMQAYKYLYENKFSKGEISAMICTDNEYYKKQAKEIGAKDIEFIEINNNNYFYNNIDILIHGSVNGENDLKYINLAQKFGKPIVSHFSQNNNSHVNVISNSGVVHGAYNGYMFEIWNLIMHKEYRVWQGNKSKKMFQDRNGILFSEDNEYIKEWLE